MLIVKRLERFANLVKGYPNVQNTILKNTPTRLTHSLCTCNNTKYSTFLKSVESTRLLRGTISHRQYSAEPTKPTKKKMAKLTEQERSEKLQPILDAGWSMVNGRDAIYREYIFKDFNQCFRFMTGVALLAESMNHHPEWFNVYNKLQVTMSTHDVGGLSAKDIRMAKYMEEEFKRFI